MQSVDFWRDLGTEFTALAEEEWGSVPNPADNQRLRAYRNTGGSDDYVGAWSLSEGRSENFRTRFEETATRAGYALDPPRGTNGLDFWLHRLYLNLLEISERRSDRSPLVVGQKNKREIIRDLCATSATYCLRLRRERWGRYQEGLLEVAQVQGSGKAAGPFHGGPDAAKTAKEPEPGTVSDRETIGKAAGHRAGRTGLPRAQQWEDVEITFLSDERIQVWIVGRPQTYNYAEFGCMDRRSERPNQVWRMLRLLAEAEGALPATARSAQPGWPAMEKQLERLRKVLRRHFQLSEDPLPFKKDTGYRLRCKIRRVASIDK